MKISETYEEDSKNHEKKKDLLKISKMKIPLEVASRLIRFMYKAEDEYQKKPITESKMKKKTKTIWEDLYE